MSIGFAQCCGTGTAGTVILCLGGTGTGIYYGSSSGSGSGTGFGAGSNIKQNKNSKNQKCKANFLGNNAASDTEKARFCPKCTLYCLEPEPKHSQSRNRNRNKSLWFHNTGFAYGCFCFVHNGCVACGAVWT